MNWSWTAAGSVFEGHTQSNPLDKLEQMPESAENEPVLEKITMGKSFEVNV